MINLFSSQKKRSQSRTTDSSTSLVRDRGRRHPWGEKVPPLPFPSRVSACEQYYAVVLCVYRGWGPTESAPPTRSRFAPCAEFVEVWGLDSEPGGWAEGRPAAAACKDQGGINKARHVTRTRREMDGRSEDASRSSPR